jgi:MoaA/NifB/PqqE/SkfB family radical SAM enzyme
MKPFDLEHYLSQGVANLIRDILRATRQNPKESAFFAGYVVASKKAEKLRASFEKSGEHIPSFLIASITTNCNLRCRGCYDRVNNARVCRDELTRESWSRLFYEAEDAGVPVILLAGGEPLMRPDVVDEAANHPSILFPVFTNGTVFTNSHADLFEKHRNLIPIISIEGDAAQTDKRRGGGVYEKTAWTMKTLSSQGLLFGVSITVTSENIHTVTADSFISDLQSKGCKAIVFVEYVPVDNAGLALDAAGRELLAERINNIRLRENMIIISFPGDEKEAGGCLAAGRGFFHINATGSAEPCPFSPHSDTSLKTATLREALRSPLFTKLRGDGFLSKEHTGGCALFEQEAEVSALAAQHQFRRQPYE